MYSTIHNLLFYVKVPTYCTLQCRWWKIIFIIFMTTFNPETGDMLSQLKTFKTLCAAFSARVRELNGEYRECIPPSR